MKKFRNTFEMEIDVRFDEPEKAKAYFIDGDWKETFWEHDDLEEVSNTLALGFDMTKAYWNDSYGKPTKMIEGFGDFIEVKGGAFESCPSATEEFGKITIRYDRELTHVGSDSI